MKLGIKQEWNLVVLETGKTEREENVDIYNSGRRRPNKIVIQWKATRSEGNNLEESATRVLMRYGGDGRGGRG